MSGIEQRHGARRQPLSLDPELSARSRHLREFPGRAGEVARHPVHRRGAHRRLRDERRAGARPDCRRAGVGTRGGDTPLHTVTYERDGVDHTIAARWLIDATGRAGLIKRKLDLAQPNDHDANAIWFRIGTRIDMDEWSGDQQWLNRCDPPYRWLSTNHLCGEGYWAWLIPLSSGSHSVGIVADQAIHPLKTMNSFERAMEWFAKYQPRLARELEGKRHLLQDFIALRRFSYGCKQVFSGSRWALTGEAGVFLDPFYSPGSDFIAISNTYITELIAKDRAGEPVAPYARLYEQFYFSFYRSTLVPLHQPVRAVRRPRSDAGEGDLGLHLLLGRALPDLLPGPSHRPDGDGAHEATSSRSAWR